MKLKTKADFEAYRKRQHTRQTEANLRKAREQEAWKEGKACRRCGQKTMTNSILGIKDSCLHCCGQPGCEVCS